MKTKRRLIFLLSTIVLTAFFNQKVKAQSIGIVKTPSNETFTSVEVLPEFPGGTEKFFSFVKKNLDQTKSSTSGRINVTFVVGKDGNLSEVRAIGRIFDNKAADEAVRIIKLSPKWTPGKQNGKPVRVQYTVPIVFNK